MSNSDDIEKPLPKAIAVKGSEHADVAGTGMPPKIVAKGSGELAEKILDIAFAEGVKVRQDKDLTELLDAFDVDSPIPLEALHAVSLILERVYAENQKLSGQQEKEDDVSGEADTPRKEAATLDGNTGKPVGQDSRNAEKTTKGPA